MTAIWKRSQKATGFPRALGAATAAFGAALVVRPELMTGPTGLRATPGLRTVVRAVGTRDLVSGLAMVLAPAGRPLRVALAARVATDASDAVVFGSALPTAAARRKSALVTLCWAALCAAAWRRAPVDGGR
ncbi:hypothetical protein [Saccharothrix hoggarensis]|uniref:Uncharacterized protein n=1 Tax=Saccharothrix hoggarensis TaxID=913853 RepID=A0ABW3QPA2_9PSEU